MLEKTDLEVSQNGSPLLQNKLEQSCWELKEAFGNIVVRWSEAGNIQETKVEIGKEGYLLFKLTGQNLNQGRLVKFPYSGSYLAIVPDEWERYEEISGPPPAMPEPVSFDGYKAHFFDLIKGSYRKIAFRCSNTEHLITRKELQFEMIGKQLPDAAERVGPLFGKNLPLIRANDEKTWNDIKTIVVGEEKSGRGKWRMSFSPCPEQKEQELPSEVAARKSGWYFLRFYDSSDNPVDSLDFRFVEGLEEIELPTLPPLPSESGYEPISVKFIHTLDLLINSQDDFIAIRVECEDNGTVLTIPPSNACDQSRWLVSSKDGSPVEVVILIERIWWAIKEGDNTPRWTDKPIRLSRDDFTSTSNKALRLKLPRQNWIDRVFAGFERSKSRSYNVKVTESHLDIPLRDYSDSQELENQTREHHFKIWIEQNDRCYEGVIGILPALREDLLQAWIGYGRKKTAVAKAILRKGRGEIIINGKSIDVYFKQSPTRAKRFLGRLLELYQVSQVLSQMQVNIMVEGSSPTGMRQPKAVAHALARALMHYDSHLISLLQRSGFGGTRVEETGRE